MWYNDSCTCIKKRKNNVNEYKIKSDNNNVNEHKIKSDNNIR